MIHNATDKFIKILVLLLPMVTFFNCCIAQTSQFAWEVDNTKIMIAQRVDVDSKYMAQIFVLDYIKDRGCNVSASVLTIANSNKLGKFKSKDIVKAEKKGNQLRFVVDGKEIEYYPERIMRVLYENGVEFGTIAPAVLMSALENGSGKIEVYLGDMKMIRIPSSTGFRDKSKVAFNNCISK